MINNIYKDITEIFNKLSQNFSNLINNKIAVNKIQKAIHYLIVFSESGELSIYNALSGDQIMSK